MDPHFILVLNCHLKSDIPVMTKGVIVPNVTGCPVLAGVKWTATKWIHTKPFNIEWLDKIDTAPDTLPEDCKVGQGYKLR